MNARKFMALTVLAMTLPVSQLQAEEHTPATTQPPLQQTVTDLIDALVKQGTITVEQGRALRSELNVVPAEAAPAAAAPGALRVPYVPEAIKNAIRDEVRLGLREDVTRDLIGQARQERWGMPGVTPEWVDKIKIKGDLRLRHQADLYAGGNREQDYINFPELNRVGGYGKTDNPFLNTTENRQRERMRLRLGIDAKVNEVTMVGTRLATGSSNDPVSTNQTLGNTARPYTVQLDQAYLRYNMNDFNGYNRMTVWGGRIPNPWVSTDLVWDPDLNFEGVAATYRIRVEEEGGLADLANDNQTIFLTMGAFPLQEVELSSRDKWLLGVQAGTQWTTDDQSQFTVALAYYDFRNITGERNSLDSRLNDFTAPQFMQKGNTLFDIRNDIDVTTDLWALAAGYKEINLTARADLASFSPIHLVLTGDYVENLGFDRQEVSARTGYTEKPRTRGYQLQVALGWPQVTKQYDWRVTAAYKRLERDAVVDAFTDSDFHLGGTDAQGWILGFEYGLMENSAFAFRWLSANAIDGPPLGIDVLQFDVNVKF